MTEVRISNARLAAFGNEIHAHMFVLGRLRDAGVPVLGDLGLSGVSSGRLEMSMEVDDLAGTDDLFVRWWP